MTLKEALAQGITKVQHRMFIDPAHVRERFLKHGSDEKSAEDNYQSSKDRHKEMHLEIWEEQAPDKFDENNEKLPPTTAIRGMLIDGESKFLLRINKDEDVWEPYDK